MVEIIELYKCFLKHPKVFIDSREAKNGGLFFALKGDRFDGNDFALKAIAEGADFAIVDRIGLKGKSKCLFVEDVLVALQQLSNYHRKQLSIPVLGITGTNGKTTTKELVLAVLKQKYNVLATQGNLNNHIGVPLTLLSVTDEHGFAVIEMGANHPGEIEFLCNIAEPDYGLITNVGKAHLEGFGSFEGVKQTKSELYRFISRKGKGVFLNNDNTHLKELVPAGVPIYTYAENDDDVDLYGSKASNDVFITVKVWFEKGWLYIKSKLSGDYNIENILAACRIGVCFGVDPLRIQKGVEEYVPSNNRSQIVQKGTTTILVDCYNANPSSMEVSLNNFIQIEKDKKIVILGDMLELGEESTREHQVIVLKLEKSELDNVLLVGNEFMKTVTSGKFHKFKDVDTLIENIQQIDIRNSFVLLKGSRGIRLEKVLE